MVYKALISFSGVVSMSKGDVKEIADNSIAKDLLKAGYIAEAKPAEKAKEAEKPEKVEAKKTTTKTTKATTRKRRG